MVGTKGIPGENFVISKKDGQVPVLKEDGRKKKTSNRAKHLRYMRIKPLVCNDCPYSAPEAGGNGICTEYKKDSICTVRKDLGKITKELDTRDPEHLKTKLDLLTTQLTEEVSFHMQMCQAGNLPPTKELVAAYKASLDGIKIMNELQTKRVTSEVTETKTLSNNEITAISRTIREAHDEATH